ncbi:MAG: restriction endonuclease subunit S [Pyrinomonadaceae bacterium]
MTAEKSATIADDTDEQTSLPEGGRLVRLGDVCEIVMGQSPSGSSYNNKGSGEPLLNGPSEFGRVYPTAVQWTTEPVRFAEAGDILFCVRGATTGRKNIADKRYCIGRGLAAIRGRDEQTTTRFLMYLLDSVTISLLGESAGSIFPNLSADKIENFETYIPTIEEQRRIATVLDEQMKAVEKARRAVEEQLAAAKLLPNAFLRAVFESEEAQSWPKRKLSEIAKTCSGTTPSRGNADYYKGSISWVKTGELKDGVILDTEEHISELALKETSLRLLPSETLLVAMYGQGQTRGRTGLLLNPATTNQACFAILPNETFDPYFLQYWFRYSYDKLRQETEGRGGNQPNLNGDVLNNRMVSLPDTIEAQRSLVEKLNDQMQHVESITQTLTTQLAAIKQMPSALLRRAFAGEV